MADAVLAIETGGTKILAALERRDGHRLAEGRWLTGTAEDAVRDVLAFVESALPNGDRVAAVGVAAFGPVVVDPAAPDLGQTLATPKAGWSDVNVGRAVANAVSAPLAVDTDVNAAALAEQSAGRDAGVASLAYVTVGTGIGAGWSGVGGRPAYALHPELGHLPVGRLDGDALPSLCPFHADCAEGLAAGPAIAQRLKAGERLQDRPDVGAVVADYLSQVAAAIVLAWSPHRIKWGGGVMATPGLLAMVQHRLDRRLGDYGLGQARLQTGFMTPASFDDAGLRGALILARNLGR